MFDVVKVFSATKQADREAMGETVSKWMRNHPEVVVVDKTVTQSSDNAYHCLTITLWLKLKALEVRKAAEG